MENIANSVLIEELASVRMALEILCRTAKQILFVVSGRRLIASVSDGDIRRFLLRGGTLDAMVREVANSHPKFLFTTERGRAGRFLSENKIGAVPIVDEDMNVEDVVFLHEAVSLDEIAIRELKHQDMTMVLEFFDQMAGDTRAMFNRGDVNRIRVMAHLSRKDPDHEVHFAATVKDPGGTEKMVGYVFLWDVHTLIPWLGIAVREDWKGHHLGRILLDHVDHHLQPKGYGGVMLTSVPANIRAHALYSRMGFEYFGNYPDGEFLYIKRYSTTK